MQVDPDFNPRTTSNFALIIEQWGTVPGSDLRELSKKSYGYGHGSEDLTMYPILNGNNFIGTVGASLSPGSFIWRVHYVWARHSWKQNWNGCLSFPHPVCNNEKSR